LLWNKKGGRRSRAKRGMPTSHMTPRKRNISFRKEASMSRLNKLAIVLSAIVAFAAFIGFSAINNIAEAGGGPRKVSVTFDMPTQVNVDETFDATVRITNDGGIMSAGFNATILYGGPCWANKPYFTDRTPGTDVYWHENYDDGQRVFWSGMVEPGKTAFYKQTTGSGSKAMTCQFATATFIVTTPQGVITAEQGITVVGKPAPKPQPTATPAPKQVITAKLTTLNSSWPTGSDKTSRWGDLRVEIKSTVASRFYYRLRLNGTCPIYAVEPGFGYWTSSTDKVDVSHKALLTEKGGRCDITLSGQDLKGNPIPPQTITVQVAPKK